MSQDEQTREILAASQASPVEVIHLGKDEMNLAEFPITLLTDRVPKGKKVIKFEDRIFDEKNGKQITRTLTISADEAHGLPTAVDDDVILGLIQLTKHVNNFTSREVEFSRLDLIRQLGWPDSGDSYRRLSTSLKRWLSVTLLYENAWRDNRKGAWITKGFHVLDNIELNDTRTTTEQGELFPSKIVWNKVVFESFEAGYLKSIDYGLYIKLRSPVARRLYRFLSKRMYFGPEMSFELLDLAIAHVGLSDNYRGNAGKIKEKLQPALDELEEAGFLEPMSKEERYQKEGKTWKIRLTARSMKPPALPAAETGPQESHPKGAEALELVARGVSPKSAERIARKHPADRIRHQVEVFDWLVERKDKRVTTSPSGYLVKSIADDYATPKGFTPKAERERIAAAREAERRRVEEAEQRERHRLAEDQKASQAAEAYWSSLSTEEQAALDAESRRQSSAEDLAVEQGMFREVAKRNRISLFIRQMLEARGELTPAD